MPYASTLRSLSHLTEGRALIVGAIGLLAVASLDYLTGWQVSFSVFYVAPVAIVAWNARLKFAIVIAILAALVWLAIELRGNFPYDSTAIPLWNMTVRLGFFLIISLLINNRRRQQELLITAKHEAEEAVRLKEEFTAHVSHEIRTPLNAVIGLSHLLQRTPVDTQQQDYLSKIQSAGQALLAVVNDILDIARIDADRLELETIDFDLERVMQRVQDLFVDACDAKGVALVTDIAPDTPTRLAGDPTRLGQILTNLVGNAVKYTSTGHVRVAIRAGRIEPDGQVELEIAIQDTGIGMSEAELERLFEPFTQAHASVARRFGGSGLGLSICRRLVDRMGGELHVRSKPGIGSEFRMRLTFGRASEDFSPDTVEEYTPPAEAARLAVMQRELPVRILLVEDNALNQQVATGLLTHLGYAVDIVTDGESALSRLSLDCSGYDAVLMDVQLPGIDGLETTRRLRELPHLQDLPIIAVTASTSRAELQSCRGAGINDCISKPIDPRALERVLRKWVAPPQVNTPPPAATALDELDPLSQLPDLDLAAALRHVDHDHVFLKDLLKNLAPEFEALVQQLRGAIAADDVRKAGRAAHTLKGLLAQVEHEAASLAADLERDIEAVGTAELAERVDELEAAVQPLLAAVCQL